MMDKYEATTFRDESELAKLKPNIERARSKKERDSRCVIKWSARWQQIKQEGERKKLQSEA